MGNAESIPVVSQFISLGQACQGDMEGALRTQEQFSRQALVISQVKTSYSYRYLISSVPEILSYLCYYVVVVLGLLMT